MLKKYLPFLIVFTLFVGFLAAEEAPSNPFIFDPTDTEGDRFYTEFINMLSTLGVILVGMLVVAWFVRRFSATRIEQANNTSSVKILETRPLSPKSALHLLEVEGTGYLIAEHAQGITKIGQFELAPDESRDRI